MSQYLISAEQLQGCNDNTVIFDCRFSLADFNLGKQQYTEGHIPGAFHLDMENDLSGSKGRHGGRHPVPCTETFAETLRNYGVNNDTLIVAYDDNRIAGAARLWWLLRFFGHENIKILNGGFAAWKAAGYGVSTVTPTTDKGNFQAQPNSLPVVDQQWLNEHIGDSHIAIIDSREMARYQGLEEPIDPVAGHIPGALNAPWQKVTTDNGFVQPEEQQQQNWQNLPVADDYVVYCGSGVTAAVNLFSLEMAGITNTSLYAGSWSDWCSYPENKIATIAAE